MGIVHRVGDLFRAKANKTLDRAEDPREMLDYAYQRQTQLVQQVRRGLAEVATSRKRIELQRAQLKRSAETLQGQAQRALATGREDLAREALTRRTAVLEQDHELQAQLTTLQEEEQKLTVASQRLEAQVDAFRARKETVKASYTAAEAETRISEAVTGVSGQMEDIGTAIQRAQDRTEQLQARAGALDELMSSGALEDPTSSVGHDELSDQLDAITKGDEVEAQLAAMKAELAPGAEGEEPPAALEAAPDEPPPDRGRSDTTDAQPPPDRGRPDTTDEEQQPNGRRPDARDEEQRPN